MSSRNIYTCGHVTELPHHQLEVKAITKEGKHRTDIMTVCENCLIWYRKNNLIIDTDEQRERWLAFNLSAAADE